MRVGTGAILGVLTLIGGIAPSLATGSRGETPSRVATTDTQDDSHWSTVGGPQELTYVVNALTLYKGNLVAGGEFLWISGRRMNAIATWTGSTWEPLGQGVEHGGCPGIPCYQRVHALLPFGDDLIVGGNFVKAGGQPANYIARWDGISWHPLGQGVDDQVYALAEFQGDIIAAGLFLNAGDQPIRYIARWDGTSWHPLGQGVNGRVNSLIVFDGSLIVGGLFSAAGGTAASCIAAWDGVAWHSMGQGSEDASFAFTIFEGQLLSDGMFRDSETLATFFLGRWDGAAWVQFGPAHPSSPTHALAVYRDALVRGFSGHAYYIERWDGNAWHPLGSGTDKRVRALLPTETSLYVGGDFLAAGGKTAWFIARWDDVITPVFVEGLATAPEGDALRISWRLSPEALQELSAVHLERAEVQVGPYDDLTHESLLLDREMAFTDRNTVAGKRYWYRLRLLSWDGSTSYAGPVEGIFSPDAPFVLLHPPVDNADRPVAIRYRIGGPPQPVQVQIYATTGHLLRVLSGGTTLPGEHLVSWDRMTASGVPAARGVYIVRLSTDRGQATQKLVLLHR